MFESTVAEGVCRLSHPGTRWLATGWDGGFQIADAAFNVSVPTGFERADLDAYARERLGVVGFEWSGPVLLTGLGLEHARGARAGSVTVVATAGLSNPTALPVESAIGDGQCSDGDDGHSPPDVGDGHSPGNGHSPNDDPPRPGTVNLLVGTTRALDDGTLATLLTTAVEAKTAALQSLTGFTGTTSDAVAVGSVTDGNPAEFAGSGTSVGSAVRACVRDAIQASLTARYPDGSFPSTVADAKYGVVTDRETDSFRP